ncbi:MAG: hypothetical protein VXB01_02570 [Opitutae bacterium]
MAKSELAISIGVEAGERNGIAVLPDVDSALYNAPTSTLTQFKALTNMSNAGDMTFEINGTQVAIPVLTTA